MKTLRKGDRSGTVVYLQERLIKRGYQLPRWGADGDFGGETGQAVEQFQSGHGLAADGIVGPATWSMLLSKGPAKPPASVLELLRAELTELATKAPRKLQRAVLATAIGDLGKRESPDGYNAGRELAHLVDGYNRYWLVLTAEAHRRYAPGAAVPDSDLADPMPWCGMATTGWIRLGLGLPMWDLSRPVSELAGFPFPRWYGGVAQVEKWAQDNGRWIPANSTKSIPPAAIWTMGRPGSGSDAGTARAGHTGLVVADHVVELVTIEGNVSNRVWSYRRKRSDLRGFVLWEGK